MATHDTDHFGKDTRDMKIYEGAHFSYGSPYHEIMPTLEKMTGQSFGWKELNFASYHGGVEQKRIQQTLFLNLAERWADWWAKKLEKLLGRRGRLATRTHEKQPC